MENRTPAGRAEAVLRANDSGGWTRPSPTQYPHQWNWDSAFISLGWARFDWERAALEIESMLAARWRSGMVPHVHYDPSRLDGYFPGPDRWPVAQTQVLHPGQLTSGMTNPPVLVVSAHRVGLRQRDLNRRLDWWSRIYPDLRDFVLFFKQHRTLPGSPLPVMVHPWESGWDNSPRWDFLGRAGLRPSRPYQRLDTRGVDASQRPTGKDYDSFLGLIEILEATGYDIAAYRELSPFCVLDVVVNAVWYRAASALGEIAEALGLEPPVAQGELDDFATAYEEAHWNEELGGYFDVDLVSGNQILIPTAAGPAALFGGFQDRERARRCWNSYQARCAGAAAVCTYPPTEPGFDPVRYWRGPVWVQVNWMVVSGLFACGLEKEAEQLRDSTLELINRGGFSEYFNPLDGRGCGSSDFSWTAALFRDWISELDPAQA